MISVIVPTYNREAFLPSCIESVRAQTCSDFELLIVDDGSTDGTAELVRTYSTRDARIRYLQNERTSGPAGARNHGIDNARGDYIAFLDSDDTWMPQKLELQLRYLEEHPGVDAIGGDCVLQWNGGTQLVSSLFHERTMSRDAIFDTILRRNYFWIFTPTVMIRRRLLCQIGMFDEEFLRCEDLDLWLRVNQNSTWAYLDSPLAVVYGKGNVDKYRGYEANRIAATGYYAMLLIEKLPRKLQLSERQRESLRRAARTSDHFFWLGRRASKHAPLRAMFYFGMALLYRYWRVEGDRRR